MKRRALLLGAASAGCRIDRRPRLNIFNWSSYIAPETVPRFEAEIGARVRYGVYEGNEEMLAKVITGNSGWDIVFPTHSRIGPMAANGLLAELDHGLLPNLGNLAPEFQRPSWDPGLRHCVPYMWNATGIAYNRAVNPAPAAWADLWSPRLKGRMTMLDDPEDVIGICLMKAGLPFDATDPAQLLVARREAIAQKPLIRAYLNADVRDQLISGDVLAAQLWSTTSEQAIRASRDVAFVYPAEGFPLYADNAAILRESRHRDLAHKFLDYLLRPQVAARNAQAAETATANGPARALLPPEMRDSPTLYPGSAIRARGFWPATLPASAQRLRDRLWTEIKSA